MNGGIFLSHKRIFTALLVAAALLTGCEQTEKTTVFDLGGYTIIRSDMADKDEVQLALTLRKRMSEVGAELGIKTDFLDRAGTITEIEHELLFGFTGREESKQAAEDFNGDENSFMIKLIGSKIVVLGGNDFSYEAAIDWLRENYDAAGGTLSIPENGYFGRWTPPLEGLTVDGTPIIAFRIVKQNLIGFGLDEAAQKLEESIYRLTGAVLEIVSDDEEPSAHEIVLGSDSVKRADALSVTAGTKDELSYLLDEFISDLEKGKIKGGITMQSPRTTNIEVTGKTPSGRGKALSDALAKVSEAAKDASAESTLEFVLTLHGGEYELPGGLDLDGKPFVKLTLRAAENERPILTGLTRVPDDSFVKVEGMDYYMAKIDSKPKVRDFYAGGKRIPLASGERGVTVVGFANHSDRKAPENARGVYVDKSSVEGLEFGSTEFHIYVEWETYILHATGVDFSDTRTVDGHELVRLKFPDNVMSDFPLKVHNLLDIKNRVYYLANDRALLKPGTCVADYENGVLYYYPESGAPKDVAYSDTDVLLKLRNAADVTLEGLEFTGTACSITAENGYYAHQANADKYYGDPWFAAVNLENCVNIAIKNCKFDGLNGNGIRAQGYVKGLSVEGCEFNDIAMTAVSVGKYTTEWSESTACYDIVIDNNKITNTGAEYPASTAVYISHADGLKLTHNTIDNCSYTGISVGWGWSVVDYDYGAKINVRNAEIAYNRITNFMELLRDGAAIYVLGANCTENYTELFNTMHDNFAEKADYKPDTGHICGYYLDGSSSNWHVYDNVMNGAKYPLYTQFNVRSQWNHNVTCERIYSTTEIDKRNSVPERNVILGETFIKPTLDELFKAFPKAKEIFDNSGTK